jgi:hypothetical protein
MHRQRAGFSQVTQNDAAHQLGYAWCIQVMCVLHLQLSPSRHRPAQLACKGRLQQCAACSYEADGMLNLLDYLHADHPVAPGDSLPGTKLNTLSRHNQVPRLYAGCVADTCQGVSARHSEPVTHSSAPTQRYASLHGAVEFDAEVKDSASCQACAR